MKPHLLIPLTLIAFAQPATAEDVRKDTGAADSIQSYPAQEKDEAVKKARGELDEFDARLEKLEQQIKEKKAQWGEAIARKKEEELAELKQERAKLEARYETLKKASQKAWQATKDAFVSGYHKLERKFDSLKGVPGGEEAAPMPAGKSI